MAVRSSASRSRPMNELMRSVADIPGDADDDLAEISPELVLVDPELARRVREEAAAAVAAARSRDRALRLVGGAARVDDRRGRGARGAGDRAASRGDRTAARTPTVGSCPTGRGRRAHRPAFGRPGRAVGAGGIQADWRAGGSGAELAGSGDRWSRAGVGARARSRPDRVRTGWRAEGRGAERVPGDRRDAGGGRGRRAGVGARARSRPDRAPSRHASRRSRSRARRRRSSCRRRCPRWPSRHAIGARREAGRRRGACAGRRAAPRFCVPGHRARARRDGARAPSEGHAHAGHAAPDRAARQPPRERRSPHAGRGVDVEPSPSWRASPSPRWPCSGSSTSPAAARRPAPTPSLRPASRDRHPPGPPPAKRGETTWQSESGDEGEDGREGEGPRDGEGKGSGCREGEGESRGGGQGEGGGGRCGQGEDGEGQGMRRRRRHRPRRLGRRRRRRPRRRPRQQRRLRVRPRQPPSHADSRGRRSKGRSPTTSSSSGEPTACSRRRRRSRSSSSGPTWRFEGRLVHLDPRHVPLVRLARHEDRTRHRRRSSRRSYPIP